jgi:hypothetical protein
MNYWSLQYTKCLWSLKWRFINSLFLVDEVERGNYWEQFRVMLCCLMFGVFLCREYGHYVRSYTSWDKLKWAYEGSNWHQQAATFCDITPCYQHVKQRFGGTYHLHLQRRKSTEQETRRLMTTLSVCRSELQIAEICELFLLLAAVRSKIPINLITNYLYHYHVTQWNKILVEKLRVAQLVTKYPVYCDAWNIVTVLQVFVLTVQKFWIQIKAILKKAVFWDVMPCGSLGTDIHRNVGSYKSHRASHPRRHSSESPPWKSQVLHNVNRPGSVVEMKCFLWVTNGVFISQKKISFIVTVVKPQIVQTNIH